MIEPKTRISHVVDILGNVIGRDQPIMLMDKAIQLVSLLDVDIFESDKHVFFDPFCKAGEILLSCAYIRCFRKACNKNGYFGLNEIKKELYESNSYFALAPDERHHKLSLRTFLGNEHSHNEEFNHIIRDGQYLSEETGKLDKEKFRREFDGMIEYISEKAKDKKIIAVGNPPYQENDGGFGGSASSIYNYFVETIIDSSIVNESVVVIPSRWFTTGKGTSEFRKKILSSRKIKEIVHFPKSKSIFPTVDILGGVCFLHYVDSHNKNVKFCDENVEVEIDLSDSDIILDDPRGYEIYRKIQKKWIGLFVSDIAWSGKPFGLRTFYFSRNPNLGNLHIQAVPCFTKRRKIMYANIDHVDRNRDKINEWKVAIPSAYAPGSKEGVRRVTLPVDQYFIIPQGHISTETYNIVGSFSNEMEAENYKHYLSKLLPRYLLGLRKVTQHIPKDKWQWVPYLDPSKEWSDQEIYELFDITLEEQEHIRKKVEEWS
ncbi:TPA: Eco57I restriction-modification methylase domain-containing protein [Legionella pneumophila]